MRKILFADTFLPWTTEHEKALRSFLPLNEDWELTFLPVHDDFCIDGIIVPDSLFGRQTRLLKNEKLSNDLSIGFDVVIGDAKILPSCIQGLPIFAPVTRLKKAQEDFRAGKVLSAPQWILEKVAGDKLFFASKIASMMTEERYAHSFSVAKTAALIASHHGLDPQRAFQAGMFHDIAKDIDKASQRSLVATHMPEFCDYPGFSLHQFAGAILARTMFGLEDEEVLSAILYHCTGNGKMSDFEKIVYTADKCEPLRPFPTGHILKDALEDIHVGFLDTIREQLAYFRRHDIDYRTNPLTEEMYRTYLSEEIENEYCHSQENA